MATTLKNFINGKFVDSLGSGSLPVVNPATEDVICHVPLSTAADVDAAVQAAQAVFPEWSNITIKQRASIMFRFHALVEKHSDELSRLVVAENGKNYAEALADVAKGNETVEWATSLPQLAAGRTLMVSGGITCQENRVPLGVVGAIVPFNFPAMVPMWTVPISLTMGNCVILKPSEKVPTTMMRMAELLMEAGLPAGVFQIVHGAVEVVTALCEHPQVSAVSFVGSSKVANIVATKCRNLNKRVLALGGAKNHLIALPDCDVGMTCKDVVASFAGCCGQRCMAASVLLVMRDGGNEDQLINEIVAASGALKAGQVAGQVGPLIDNIAKERVLSYISAAEAGGARILLDGRSWAKTQEKGFWVGPTVILHNNRDDAALKEEIFGPVLSIYKVDSWDEAITIENGNPYGNAACIYTEKGANAEWFVKRFRCAMIGVNIGIPVPREPFSFGGLYGTESKYGDADITGDGAMEFFSNRIKVTSKWSSSYSTATAKKRAANDETTTTNGQATNGHANEQTNTAGNGHSAKMAKVEDRANFDGNM